MNRTVMQEKLSATPEGKALLKVIKAAGGPKELAAELAVSSQVVDNWIYLSGRVSKSGALAIESAFEGVRKEDLRPDVTNWDLAKGSRDLMASLESTPRGQGLLLALSKLNNSRKALAGKLGVSRPSLVNNWMARGYLPKRHVQTLLALPEFEGVTAEMIRPDLHEMDY